jgi:hypothetical protein
MIGKDIDHDRLIGAYNLILKNIVITILWICFSVHPYRDPHSGLIKYADSAVGYPVCWCKICWNHCRFLKDFINKKIMASYR